MDDFWSKKSSAHHKVYFNTKTLTLRCDRRVVSHSFHILLVLFPELVNGLRPRSELRQRSTPESHAMLPTIHESKDRQSATDILRIDLNDLQVVNIDWHKAHILNLLEVFAFEEDQADARQDDIGARPIVLVEETLDQPIQVARQNSGLEQFGAISALVLNAGGE